MVDVSKHTVGLNIPKVINLNPIRSLAAVGRTKIDHSDNATVTGSDNDPSMTSPDMKALSTTGHLHATQPDMTWAVSCFYPRRLDVTCDLKVSLETELTRPWKATWNNDVAPPLERHILGTEFTDAIDPLKPYETKKNVKCNLWGVTPPVWRV
ncbi:hypothetical protein RRG08_011702 [Elysia crispata]|uniref:Uncharacterized protein n=1 Tax=Elysia crispata TaxID=231223 RepID=A0AAE1BDG7_9GAST|nr:hypothetical protein RRG08_011702 [Elysia crispata]